MAVRPEFKAAIVGAVASAVVVGTMVGIMKPREDVVIPPSVVKPTYDPGLYTPFTRPPRPPHPASIYTPPSRTGSPATP